MPSSSASSAVEKRIASAHRLAMHEGRVERRLHQPLALRLRHFDEEAEKIIVLEFELADVGERRIARLQFGDDPAAFVAQPRAARRVRHRSRRERNCRRAFQRQIGRPEHRRAAPRCAGSASAAAARGLLQIVGRSRDRTETRCDGFGGAQGIADRGEIAWSAALQSEARKGRARSGAAFKQSRRSPRKSRSSRRRCDGVEPAQDRRRDRSAARETLGEQTAAGGRHGQIDGRDQRAVAMARKRARQFEIGARRRIDLHMRIEARARRQTERGAAPRCVRSM